MRTTWGAGGGVGPGAGRLRLGGRGDVDVGAVHRGRGGAQVAHAAGTAEVTGTRERVVPDTGELDDLERFAQQPAS